jgi:flagellin
VAFSVNTNIASLQAQEYLRVNSDFQGKTIGRVTSGLRITSSGDDAAGLAIANGFRSDQAVLTQGIRNANDGLSQLQIIDGGLNNISKLLDRARTLATQSASGTFTGSRTVLNSEFQSVLTEIDRQAQAIGLNTSGEFARSLNVFIGGGKTSGGTTAITNGSVAVNLSSSTVDASSLGLKGVQAKGTDATDIGSGSATTSVSAILANTTNTASQASANTARFVLRGPGFSGQGAVISVNTASTGGTSDLVTRVNAAIESAEAGGTASATALRNAGIRASVVTDSSGRQQLAFNSSTTAFQVEGGDRTANALLGKFERNATVLASDTGVNVNTNGATTLNLAIDGGTAFNVTFTDNGSGGTTSKGSIVNQLNGDSTFAAGAVAYLEGNQVVIKSKSNASTSSIAITNGTLASRLGLNTTGATVTTSALSASTGADVVTRVQGRTAVENGSTIRGTAISGRQTITTGSNDTLDITVGSTNAALTLAAGTNLTAEELLQDLNTKINASALNNRVRASLDNSNRIVLTALNSGETLSVNTSANNAYTALGLTASTSATTNVFYSSDTIKFRFQGGGLDAPVDVTLDATTAGTTTVSTVLNDLVSKVTNNSSLQAAGITISTSSAGNNITFKSSSGEAFEVQVTGDTQNKLGFGSFNLGSGQTVDYTTITGSAALTPTYDPGYGASAQSTLQFSLNGGGSSTNAITVTQLADRALVTGGDRALGAGVIGAATGNLILSLGGTSVTTSIVNGATLAVAVAAINTAIDGSALGANSGYQARIIGAGATTKVQIEGAQGASSIVVSASSAAATLSDLNLTANTTSTGNSVAAIRTDIVEQINSAVASDTQLAAAGIKASLSGSNELVLESTNGTSFRVSSYGETDLGFGKNNINGYAGFAGTTKQGAPLVSPTLNAGGADSSTSLTFTDLAYGSDDQQVTITATDSSGVKQSLSVTLRNDDTARNARTIDDALKTINDALQQSNNSTLNRIFAVKENTGGTEKVRFLSTVKSFEVAIGGTANSTGFTSPTGGIDEATTVGTGANSTIDTQTQAESAVTALANAVTALGNAQAVVGRGQNQFNFAVNLASSQLTNLAASESRIRDADLAQEAANLTKAQISLQAGVAALAQANSAPQAVLGLLRG